MRGSTSRGGGLRAISREGGLRASSTDDVGALQAEEEEDEEGDGEVCLPSDVTAYNEEEYTVLEIKIQGFPGLFRVIAWVINGLELTVEGAQVDTTDDGLAINRFWLVDRKGRRLPPHKAELLADRVAEFVRFCTPDARTMAATHFKSEVVEVCNNSDPRFTLVSVRRERPEHSTLLQLASVLTGIGLEINKGSVSRVGERPGAKAPPSTAGNGPPSTLPSISDASTSVVLPNAVLNGDRPAQYERVYKFWVTDSSGSKLTFANISSLLFVMDVVLLNRFANSKPPLAPAAQYSVADAGCDALNGP